uniref:uncharacterized protein LOC122597680 n=1 Tax=Erigeron canadensis TaxID=72917 RepID=UPI001CB8FDF5|nr:uncharacterized protein LOC122597680 [Erigeron canadensis]
MGRAKLRMEFITNEKARNRDFEGKTTDFSTLCDVDTVMIMYPPNNSNKPDIWPNNDHNKTMNTITSYKSKKGDQTRIRTYNLIDFFKDRQRKIEDALLKARIKNMEAKYPTWFDKLDGLNICELTQFAMWLQNKEKIVMAHLDLMKRNNNMTIIQQPFMFSFDNRPAAYVSL